MRELYTIQIRDRAGGSPLNYRIFRMERDDEENITSSGEMYYRYKIQGKVATYFCMPHSVKNTHLFSVVSKNRRTKHRLEYVRMTDIDENGEPCILRQVE